MPRTRRNLDDPAVQRRGAPPPQRSPESQRTSQTTVPSTEPFTFTAVARLQLDELLEQLIDRAGEVLRTQGRLRGLLRATQAISIGLDLPTLLQRIVGEARTLVGARYAALGVVADDGTLSQFVHSGMDAETVEMIGHLPTGRGLLGQLIADPHTLRLPDLSRHASSVGFPPGHPPMHSFLGVPVRIRGRVFGNLYLAEKLEDDEFTADDEELVLALASAAAAVIDNATLFDGVTRRQIWLDASRALNLALLDVEGRDAGLELVTRRLRGVAGADIAVLVASVGTGNTVVAAADGPGAEQLRGTSVSTEGVLAQAMRERTARVIADASVAEGELGAIPGLGIGPIAVLPLAAREEALGALAVGNRQGGHVFDEQDLSMMGDFANQAALVLLESANQANAHQLAMSEERARIARDLHDHSIQEIFAVGMSLNALAGRVSGPEAEMLIDLVDQLDSAIRSIRCSIFALRRPAERAPQALGELLQGVVTELTHGLGFTPLLRVTPSAENRVPTTVFPDLVAVVRESLSNVARHAQATQVAVTVDADDKLVVEVVDDGRGFVAGSRSSGLANLRERAQGRGGICTVTAGEHGGTRVHWSVPLSQAP